MENNFNLKEMFDYAEKVLNLAKLMDDTFTNSLDAQKAHLKLCIAAALSDAHIKGWNEGFNYEITEINSPKQ